MSWFYGESMNNRSLDLHFEGLTFKCEKCDLSKTLYVEDNFDMLNINPKGFAKAYGTFIGYHASAILPELNGFQGYGSVDFEVVK
ncbi:conserved hypothetical protein [Vibrio phage 193E37-1]|nr:conserved hypothetical protein [Vibrio phage 193E37-1]